MIGLNELKAIGKILQEAGKIEQYQQILELQQQLLDMQGHITELSKENKQLKDTLEIQGNLIFESNAYWLVNGDLKQGPYCSCCWDDEKKTIRMQPCGNPAFYSCPKCENKSVEIYPEQDSFKKVYKNRSDNQWMNSAR